MNRHCRTTFVLMATAALLTACGGGGGGGESTEDLVLTFDYTPQVVALWGDINDAPNISGLEGNAPSCAVSAGALPDGVTVDRSTCVVSGQPNETGDFAATIRLTVSGYSGFVETTYATAVTPLDPTYNWEFGANASAWALPFRDSPTIDRFTKRGSDVITYELLGGLPAGMKFNTTNGVISGTPTETGSFTPRVRLTITRDGRTSVSDTEQQPLVVREPVTGLRYDPPRMVAGNAYSFGPTYTDTMLDSTYEDYDYRLSDQPDCPGVLPSGWTLQSWGAVKGTAAAGLDQCVGITLQVRQNGLVKDYPLTLKLKV